MAALPRDPGCFSYPRMPEGGCQFRHRKLVSDLNFALLGHFARTSEE